MSRANAVVAVIGAGLAGLVAAATLVEHDVEVVVLEAAPEPGGTSALSSGWIWRYRDMKAFARYAPTGDRGVQQALFEALPDALVWLDRSGVRLVATGTDNPLTDGVRVDPPQAIDALVRRLPTGVVSCNRRVVHARHASDGTVVLEVARPHEGAAREGAPTSELTVDRVVCCGGGYGGDLDRIAREAGVAATGQRRHWALRNSGRSDGSSLDAAVALGALRVPVNGECYARAMPVGVDLWVDDFVRFAQVYGEHASLVDDSGVLFTRESHDWSDAQLMWRLARGAGRGWYLLDQAALAQPTPYGPVSRSVREAQSAGAVVLECGPGDMVDLLAGQGVRLGAAARGAAARSVCAVAVRPGITHTMCGVRIDAHGRVLTRGRGRTSASDVVFAAGVEAGGVGNGGYASGLAQALALGRLAGTAAASA